MINIHPDSVLFTNTVFESTFKLIKNNIWPINILDFKSWMKNFKTVEERFLCACLLDSLLFRPNAQILSSFNSIFNQHLPSLQYKYPSQIVVKFDILSLLKKNQYLVKLVTVNCENSKGKSSHVLANILRKKLGILQQNIISPEDISYFYEDGTSLFIFIDDFLGSGDQFGNQLINFVKPNWDTGLIIYCPLIAHEKGMDEVLRLHPNIMIHPVEKIAKDYCFFEKYFMDYGNDSLTGKKFYKKCMDKFGLIDEIYGYKDLGVSVAFEHSCPDNTLLAFRGESSSKFAKLF